MNWVHLACLTPRILLSSHHSELIKSKCETFWHPFGPFPNTNFNPELFLLDSSLFFLRASQAKGTPRLASLFYMTCGKGTNGVWGEIFIFFFLPSESPTPTMASCMPLMTTKQVRVLSGKKTRGHCSLYLLSLKILLFFLDCFTDTYIISGSKNSHVIRYL